MVKIIPRGRRRFGHGIIAKGSAQFIRKDEHVDVRRSTRVKSVREPGALAAPVLTESGGREYGYLGR